MAVEPAAGSADASRDEGRSARKRRAILEAATELFLRQGYQGTSMDQIAALAAVSKQTVYKHFSDKERLFADILLGIADRVSAFIDAATETLRQTEDLEHDLRQLARRYIVTVMQPEILRPRRVVIAEAGRLPDLARGYYQRAPERTLAALASCFQDLAERGLLQIDDPQLAANHFAFLILGMPLDRAMFYGDDERPSPAELERLADAGVRVFLAAYGGR